MSFGSLLELGFGAFLVLLWPFWGASCGSFTCHGSLKNLGCSMRFAWFLMFWGALVAFGVCVLRRVVDFSCPGGQVEAFRGVSEAFGGHFGGQQPSKSLNKY